MTKSDSPTRGAARPNPIPPSLDLGSLGSIRLDAIRETALRAGRLAEALFEATEGDVVAVRDGLVWRGKPAGAEADDAVARFLAQSETDLWIADSHLEPRWRDHPGTQGAGGIRFCATAVIRLANGYRFGVVRVFDARPRPFDARLAGHLRDIADFVAEACDRLLHGDVKRLRELFDQAPGFICLLRGPDHVHELVNDAYARFAGEREVLGRPYRDAFPEMAAQGGVTILDRVRSTGEPYEARATRVRLQRRPGGPLEEAFIDLVCQPIRDVQGAVAGIFVQGQDVTREAMAVEQLRTSQVQLQAALSANLAILDQSLDVICTLAEDGCFTQVSKRSAEVWGYLPQEMAGRHFSAFLHPEDQALTAAAFSRIRSDTPTGSLSNRFIHKDGRVVPLMWSAAWSSADRQVVAIARDMGEHLAVEQRLQQAQKMEALGRLTGGIAHDFNNLLAVVLGTAETLAEGLADRPELEQAAALNLEAAQRGAALVSQLLTFARKQPATPQAVDCTALVSSLVPMLRRTIGPGVEIVSRTPPTPVHCVADPNQLTSALLNICINARDAMPRGGRLSITASRPPVRDPSSGHPQNIPGPEVVFEVEDTGHGMSEETLGRVMEPFFTTKPVGEGTGLGLSTVHGFVTEAGGRIEIESELQRGTCVRISLPAMEVEATAASTPEPAILRSGDMAHVLLVEDDDLVRRQVEAQLRGLNYRVSLCSNAREAAAVLASCDDIQVLLTDIVMPGEMNGRELADLARRLYPKLRIVLTSGYAEPAVAGAANLPEGIRLLPKPYRRADLAQVLAADLADA